MDYKASKSRHTDENTTLVIPAHCFCCLSTRGQAQTTIYPCTTCRHPSDFDIFRRGGRGIFNKFADSSHLSSTRRNNPSSSESSSCSASSCGGLTESSRLMPPPLPPPPPKSLENEARTEVSTVVCCCCGSSFTSPSGNLR